MYLTRRGLEVNVQCPAKLNLFLEVLARRDDGLHEIETLILPIGLFDTLTFAPIVEPAIRLDCSWAPGIRGRLGVARDDRTGSAAETMWGRLPDESGNIVVRAVELLAARAEVGSGAQIKLTKRIPAEAGLGGGSSDAAAALVAANTAWNLQWSREELIRLAEELGSDVPFFLGQGAAICRGHGERIEPIAGVPLVHFVVVRPPDGLSTRDVYLGCLPADEPRSIEPLVRALRHGDLAQIGRQLFNRLQPAAEHLSSWVQNVQSELSRIDCVGHQMTGSGTSCFGICRSAHHALRVSRLLRGRHVGSVFRASSLPGPLGIGLRTHLA